MAIAQKAIPSAAKIKLLIWGQPGTGKSRVALSSPAPLVVDLEGSTALYAGEFDFLLAEKDLRKGEEKPDISSCTTLVKAITDEIIAGVYPGVETLVIDPVTDYLDELEGLLAAQYEKRLKDISVADLSGIQRAKYYAYRREETRKRLDKIKALPLNIVLVARSRLVWEGQSGNLRPAGETADVPAIVESVMDVVVQMQKREGGKYKGVVTKTRLGTREGEVEFADFADLMGQLKAFEEKARAPRVTARPGKSNGTPYIGQIDSTAQQQGAAAAAPATTATLSKKQVDEVWHLLRGDRQLASELVKVFRCKRLEEITAQALPELLAKAEELVAKKYPVEEPDPDPEEEDETLTPMEVALLEMQIGAFLNAEEVEEALRERFSRHYTKLWRKELAEAEEIIAKVGLPF
ncbi:MAG: ATP-binding protein [Symbiobacteriaceae bacterium]|nr:ATP-binding protein [Symbiobacteriaceae bacterium]